MATSTVETELREDAKQLEGELERPVVPGELVSWANAVSQAAARAAASLRSSVEKDHSRRYAEIAHQDPGLLHRVDYMKREDRALLVSAAKLGEQTSHLAAEAARGRAEEASLESTRAEIVKLGIDFVVRVRTQEAALQTWYREAFYRDRGTVD